MRKIIYIAITFIICLFLKLQNIWLGFLPVFLSLSFFKIDKNFLWEIPLAVLLCDILLVIFTDDVRMLIYILAIASTGLVSLVSAKKLYLLFPIVILSVVVKNIYTVSALWAAVWYATRTIIAYFTTKQFNLQEYKL